MLINFATGRFTVSTRTDAETVETIRYAVTAFQHVFSLRERRNQTFTGIELSERIMRQYSTEGDPRVTACIQAIQEEASCAAMRGADVCIESIQ